MEEPAFVCFRAYSQAVAQTVFLEEPVFVLPFFYQVLELFSPKICLEEPCLFFFSGVGAVVFFPGGGNLAIGAREAGNEKWKDPEKNHPTDGSSKWSKAWVHSLIPY